VPAGNERAKRVYEEFGFSRDNVQYAKILKINHWPAGDIGKTARGN
jgi:hypothetical protein